jgi:hypothetical protein
VDPVPGSIAMTNFMPVVPSTQSSLPEQLVEQARSQVFPWEWNTQVSRLDRVNEHVMASLGTTKDPAVCFQPPDQFPTVNGG